MFQLDRFPWRPGTDSPMMIFQNTFLSPWCYLKSCRVHEFENHYPISIYLIYIQLHPECKNFFRPSILIEKPACYSQLLCQYITSYEVYYTLFLNFSSFSPFFKDLDRWLMLKWVHGKPSAYPIRHSPWSANSPQAGLLANPFANPGNDFCRAGWINLGHRISRHTSKQCSWLVHHLNHFLDPSLVVPWSDPLSLSFLMYLVT